MRNPISHLLFGRGRIPEAFRDRIVEGPLYMEEGVRAHVTFRPLTAPGVRANVRRQWTRAAILVTPHWMGVFARARPLVNVATDDPLLDAVDVDVRDGALCLAADLAILRPDASGHVELVLKVSDPAHAVDAIRSGRSRP